VGEGKIWSFNAGTLSRHPYIFIFSAYPRDRE
jgi:hypothetical protein